MLVTFCQGKTADRTEDWDVDVVPRVGEHVSVESFVGTVQSVEWYYVAPDREESPKCRAVVVLA